MQKGAIAGYAVAALLALYFMCEGEAAAAVGQNYYVGAWSTIPSTSIVAKYGPLFSTYLTQQIGPLYNPPISFTVVPYYYDTSTKSQAMIDAGKLDFAYHLGGVAVCLEATFGYSIIGTQVDTNMGYETSCVGSVIFSSAANTKIRNISDFGGKRVGVGFPWSLPSFSLGAQLLDSQGFNIYTKFEQVVFYMTDYAGLVNGVINGDIDVGVMQTGWIESNMPAGTVNQLLYHDVVSTSYHSETYPFPTSTKLVASMSLSAAPHVTAQLQQQVSAALRKLTSDHPAAQAAKIARFNMPASYEDARAVVTQLGLMQVTPTGKFCRDIFEGVDSILACPAGYLLKDNVSLHSECDAAGLSCPAGKACFCRPCYLNTASNVFPWQLVLGMCIGLLMVGVCFRLGWTEMLGWHEEEFAEYIPRRKAQPV